MPSYPAPPMAWQGRRESLRSERSFECDEWQPWIPPAAIGLERRQLQSLKSSACVSFVAVGYRQGKRQTDGVVSQFVFSRTRCHGAGTVEIVERQVRPENVGSRKERTGSWLVRYTVSDRCRTFLPAR